MSIAPSTLYYTAALLHAATMPKHTLVGINKIAPASAAISGSEHAVTKKLITPTWLHTNVFLATFVLLNVKWARNGGAGTMEEKAMVWVQAIGGAWVGLKYYQAKMYVGLGVLWGAAGATTLGMLLQEAVY